MLCYNSILLNLMVVEIIIYAFKCSTKNVIILEMFFKTLVNVLQKSV